MAVLEHVLDRVASSTGPTGLRVAAAGGRLGCMNAIQCVSRLAAEQIRRIFAHEGGNHVVDVHLRIFVDEQHANLNRIEDRLQIGALAEELVLLLALVGQPAFQPAIVSLPPEQADGQGSRQQNGKKGGSRRPGSFERGIDFVLAHLMGEIGISHAPDADR